MAERPTERLYTGAFGSGLRVETRSLPGEQPARMIGGYAAVFGKRSHPMGGIREIVEPSFFNKSQADGWPMAVARFEHDARMLLGSTAGGTLQLKIDGTGLDYSVLMPESRSDVWELADRGDLPGSSFSFQAYQDDWRLGDGGIPQRHLVTGRLIDVAPTAIPAYPDATVKTSYRSLAMWAEAELGDVERAAEEGKMEIFFRRTDNIDKRDKETPPETESRSVTMEDKSHETHVHVHLDGKPVEAAKAVEAEARSEPQPEPQPEPAAEPEPKAEPKVEATSTKAEPEPKAEPAPKPVEPQADPGLLELMTRRNRLYALRPEDPITVE